MNKPSSMVPKSGLPTAKRRDKPQEPMRAARSEEPEAAEEQPDHGSVANSGRTCDVCNTEVVESASFCWHCGAEFDPQIKVDLKPDQIQDWIFSGRLEQGFAILDGVVDGGLPIKLQTLTEQDKLDLGQALTAYRTKAGPSLVGEDYFGQQRLETLSRSLKKLGTKEFDTADQAREALLSAASEVVDEIHLCFNALARALKSVLKDKKRLGKS